MCHLSGTDGDGCTACEACLLSAVRTPLHPHGHQLTWIHFDLLPDVATHLLYRYKTQVHPAYASPAFAPNIHVRKVRIPRWCETSFMAHCCGIGAQGHNVVALVPRFIVSG